MALYEWGAIISSLFYLFFAIKNKPICFIFGIIGSGIWALVSFNAGLKFDAGLQLFYVLISLLGLYNWTKGSNSKLTLPITEYTVTQHLGIIGLGILSTTLLIYISRFVEYITLPMLDASTTVFLVIGTLLLIQRKHSSWIYLVVADFVYIYIYGVSGLWLFAAMMVIYIVFGIFGYINWSKIKKGQLSSELSA